MGISRTISVSFLDVKSISLNRAVGSMRSLFVSFMVLLGGLFMEVSAQQVLETQIRMSDCTITRGGETALGSEMSSSSSLILTSAKLGVLDMSLSGNVYWQDALKVDMDSKQRPVLRITKNGSIRFSFSDKKYRLKSIECDNNLSTSTSQPTYVASDNSEIKINPKTKSMLWESDDPNGDESVTITVTKNEARIYRIKIGYIAQGLEVKYVDVDMSNSEYALSDSPEMAFTKWDGTSRVNNVMRLKAGDFGIDMTSGAAYLYNDGSFHVDGNATCRFYSYKVGVTIHSVHFSITGPSTLSGFYKYGFSSASPGCAASSVSTDGIGCTIKYDWGYVGGAENIIFTGSTGADGKAYGARWRTMRIYYTEEPKELPDLAAPEIKGTSPFYGTTIVTIDHEADSQVYYTKDESTPDVEALSDGSIRIGNNAILYTGSFTLNESAVITAVNTREGHKVSSVVKKEFTKFAKSEQPVISGEAVFAENTLVTITGKEGDKIFYTLDGSDPQVAYVDERWGVTSESTMEYSSPFNISDTYQIKAIAINTGSGPSDVSVREFVKLERSSLPVISGAALFLDKTEVLISGVPDERFFYTLDGSVPEINLSGSEPVIKNGKEYSGPFDITESGTLKVIGYEAGKYVSHISEKVFKKSGQSSEVEITGTTPFLGETHVSIGVKKSSGSEAVIYYTTDGSEPEVAEDAGGYKPKGTTQKYESEFILTSTATVKATAVEVGLLPGPVAVRTFHKVDKSESPVINGEDVFVGEMEVEITAPANAKIFYTTDGTMPEVRQNDDASETTESGTTRVYDKRFTISSNTEVKAVCAETGKLVSDVAVRSFVRQEESAVPEILASTLFYEKCVVEIKAAPGAKIYYTLDGSIPSVSSSSTLHYSSPFSIDTGVEIKAICVEEGKAVSKLATLRIAQRARSRMPLINVASEFDENTTVSIVASEGARIFFTTEADHNPSVEISESGEITFAAPTQEYSAPFAINKSSEIKALSVEPGLRCSEIVNATSRQMDKTEAPIIEGENPFAFQTDVAIKASSTSRILYTLDGSPVSWKWDSDRIASPAEGSSTKILGRDEVLHITQRTIVRAVASESGKRVSDEARITFVPMDATPAPKITGRTSFIESSLIELSLDDADSQKVKFFYTLDGSEPHVAGVWENPVRQGNTLLYSNPVTVTSSVTFKAIAWRKGNVPGASSSVELIMAHRAAVPVIDGENDFTGTTRVTISSQEGSRVFYSIDGSDPWGNVTENGVITGGPIEYTKEVELVESTVVKAVAVGAHLRCSDIAEKTFNKKETSLPVIINAPELFGDEAAIELKGGAGATIYYTLDGTAPDRESILYTGPFKVYATTTVKAVSFEEGKNPSAVATLKMLQMEKSQEAVINGTSPFVHEARIELSAASGAKIYYTLDGTDPDIKVIGADEIKVSENSILYVEAFSIDKSCVIKAIAIEGSKRASAVSERSFTRMMQSVSPVISGVTPFENATEVEITCEPGRLIFYTKDGSDPKIVRTTDGLPVSDPATSTISYEGAFEITESCVIKAIAADASHDASEIASKAFTKYDVSEPVVIKGVTPFGDEADVEMTASPGAKIYFTTDGSEPTEESALYEGTFVIKEGCTIRAIAIEEGKLKSVEKSLSFVQMPRSDAVVITGEREFEDKATILLSAEDGATLYYTLDGSVPTAFIRNDSKAIVSENAVLYDSPIIVPKTTTVTAIAISSGKRSSVLSIAKFECVRQLSAPVISGVTPFEQESTVTITSTGEGKIFYTLDGTSPQVVLTEGVATPKDNTRLYSGPFVLRESTVVSAILWDEYIGLSEVSRKEFVLKARSANVKISASEFFGDEADVEMSSAPGAKIYYVLDGSIPSESSTLYSAPFIVGEACVIKAIAVEEGKTPSLVSELSMKQFERSADVIITGESEFSNAATVELSSTSGSRIFYTIDGSTPMVKVRNNSDLIVEGTAVLYSCPIEIDRDTHVKALSVEDGKRVSLVAERKFTRLGDSQVKIVGNEYFNGETEVSFIAEEGAYVFYTLDGTTPVAAFDDYGRPIASGTTYVYSGSLIIRNSVLLKARGAWPDRLKERIAERLFKEAEKSEPVRIVGETYFDKSTTVSISGNPEEKIFYSTDGSMPVVVYDTDGNPSADGNTQTKEYLAPFELQSTTTVKAVGVGRKKASSDVVVMQFIHRDSSSSNTVSNDGSEVQVIDGRIIAPEGSKVYNLAGMDLTMRWKQGKEFDKGIYVVIVSGSGAIPKRVKVIL